MNQKLEKTLLKKYPKLFPNGRQVDMRESLICFGMECGDGWYWLLDQLCRALQSRVDNTHPSPPQPVFVQIKEKFGGLRAYVSGGDSGAMGMVDLAEQMSYNICESCGSAKNVGCTSGWVSVRCGHCAVCEGIADRWKSNEERARRNVRRLKREAEAKAAFKAQPHPFPRRQESPKYMVALKAAWGGKKKS